ncbi:MAG: hypothetical protein V4436_02775 [Patescibacteria group bacterium]
MTKGHSHRGEEVRVGDYTIMAGGTTYLRPEDLRKADLLIPLTTNSIPYEFGKRYQVLAMPLVDYGGVPDYWKEWLEVVIDELKQGKKILAFCEGSHGRTGTFIASLIALLESEKETPDPIAAARERHCEKAVETRAQAEAVFALRERQLSSLYEREFSARPAFLPGAPQPKV